ncbi:MAG: pyroglutamyl-peptidase I [Pirellulaceae bacterium]
MLRILLTAFGPYQTWQENASWLTLVQLAKNLPENPEITTRRYPVNLEEAREMLVEDLAQGFDYAIHLGQSPGSTALQLENIAINVFDDGQQRIQIDTNGPLAYECPLPLQKWAQQLGEMGVPAKISDHAGTYLCNAVYYLSSHITKTEGLATQSVFIHVPITDTQATSQLDIPSMPPQTGALAVRRILGWITEDQ